MLQTVKLKHFLNKWKVSSNLDIFVLFCLCSPEPKVQAPVDFTLTIFTCTFYFIFFSPAPLCQYSIQTWLKTYWCEGAFKGFFFPNEGSVPLSGKYNVKIMKRVRSYTTSTAPFRMIKKIYPDFDCFQMIVNKIASWSVLITPIGGFFILLYAWGIIENFYPM